MMNFVIVVDAYPLGQLCNPKRTATSVAVEQWRQAHIAAGNRFAVPEVADYEIRRDMLQRGSVNGLALLDKFIAAEPGRYLPLTTADMRLAAQFWARARNAGTPTADPLSLDADVILAAQAANLLLPPGSFIIATSNVRHLTQFVAAEEWHKILP